MPSNVNEPDPAPDSTNPSGGPTCNSGGCKVGVCSPCLIIWGMFAAYVLIALFMEMFK